MRGLRQFSQAMARGCELQGNGRLKSGGGHVARRHTPVVPPLGRSSVLAAGVDLDGFARSVIGCELAEMVRRETGVRMGEDPEETHQMRVAIRRLRAALRLLRDYLPRSVFRETGSLGWLGSALGAVRDLDLELARLHAWRAASERGDHLKFGPILEMIASRRVQARDRLIRALDSHRYASLIRRMEERLKRPFIAGACGKIAAVEVMPELIRPLHKAVVQAGRGWKAQLTPAAYHRLRVRCKRLRYSLDFAARLGGRHLGGPRKRLAALQELLGELNDVVVARASIRAWIEESGVLLPRPTLSLLVQLDEDLRIQGEVWEAGFPECYHDYVRRPWRRLERILRRA